MRTGRSREVVNRCHRFAIQAELDEGGLRKPPFGIQPVMDRLTFFVESVLTKPGSSRSQAAMSAISRCVAQTEPVSPAAKVATTPGTRVLSGTRSVGCRESSINSIRRCRISLAILL